MHPTQIAVLSKMFSTSIVSEMSKKGHSRLFGRLLIDSNLLNYTDSSNTTVGDAFDIAFSLLKQSGLRTEYIYRSALIQNILLGRHSLRTASALTEFRIGSCKADLIILNGSATVYEIKSDRDSLLRLNNQITNYLKVFSKVYIIAGVAHIDSILEMTSENIGIMSLSRWNRITTIREVKEDTTHLSAEVMFDSLRLSEATHILDMMNINYPNLPNTLIRTELRRIYSYLDPKDVQEKMIGTLKKTRNLAPMGSLLSSMPLALQTMALMVQLRNKDHSRLIETLNKPIDEALNWN